MSRYMQGDEEISEDYPVKKGVVALGLGSMTPGDYSQIKAFAKSKSATWWQRFEKDKFMNAEEFGQELEEFLDLGLDRAKELHFNLDNFDCKKYRAWIQKCEKANGFECKQGCATNYEIRSVVGFTYPVEFDGYLDKTTFYLTMDSGVQEVIPGELVKMCLSGKKGMESFAVLRQMVAKGAVKLAGA